MKNVIFQDLTPNILCKKVLYVRLGNRTKPLDDPEEIIEYIEEDKK